MIELIVAVCVSDHCSVPPDARAPHLKLNLPSSIAPALVMGASMSERSRGEANTFNAVVAKTGNRPNVHFAFIMPSNACAGVQFFTAI